MRNTLNIVVVAFWLLMQSFSVAHSYSHQLHHCDRTGGAGTTVQETEPSIHDHALHKHDHTAHAIVADAEQPLDASVPGQNTQLDCCDDTQCKAGEMLPTYAASGLQQPFSARIAHKSSSISWSPGSLTPPPNTTV